jgi:hypothetical protein
VCAGLLLCESHSIHAEDAVRTRSGLQVLYDFSSTKGQIIDRSGVGKPLNLTIGNEQAVRRSADALELRGETLLRSNVPATKLIEAVRRSNAITIEAWIRPANTSQDGPARIVTLSRDSTNRNFTLGQEAGRYDARLRTTRTSSNGIPSLQSLVRSVQAKLTHIVYMRDRAGQARIYVNGKQNSRSTIAGDMTNWDARIQLALGNELSGERPWRGTYHLVAIYSRALSRQEVEQNFKAGAGAATVLARKDAGKHLFETQIAPLLAQRCFECHDSSSKKGKLDLSRKALALAGGESGRLFVPGKSAESLIWEQIASNDMPKKRAPLTVEQKAILRKWIDDGATWSLDWIDPAVYAHGRGSDKVWLQRLTVPEYVNTVRAAVGVDISKDAREILPRDLRADGFSNTAYNLHVDLKHVESYAKLAEIIVSRMDVEKFAARFSRSKRLTDDDMRALIAGMGKWLLRGPLEDHEITTYRGISTTVASSGGTFREAVSYIVEAMLQSPRFIYRVENQRGDGTGWPVGPYELASRLSYIIWGAPPDEALMRAADGGELSDREKTAAHVERMLRDPRAVQRSIQFLDQWLHLERLEYLRPNAKKFPAWNDELAADMRVETIEFFKEVAWKQNRPLSELFSAQFTFASTRLAEHYGLKPNAKSEGAARYDLSAVSDRGGLLTHGSVLTVGGDEASMVSRGLFVLHDLLRGTVKDPPPCVDTTPVPTKSGLTQRGIAEARIANKNCGGCHSKFEPLAFGLEKFDGLGAFHDKDKHGNALRDDGEILFPGAANAVKYQSSVELMNLLAASDRVRRTMTWKLTQFALGRPLGSADAPIVDKIHEAAQKGGGTYRSLMTAIVMSDLVQLTRTEIE